MEVIHVTGDLSLKNGGGTSMILSIIKSLKSNEKCQVSLLVCCRAKKNSLNKEALKAYGLILDHSLNTNIQLTNSLSRLFLIILGKSLNSEDKLVIHLHGVWSAYSSLTASLCSLLNIPVILSPHGMLSSYAREHKTLKKRIAWIFYQKWICQRVDGFHATSDIERRELESLSLRPQIHMILPGVWPREHTNSEVNSITPLDEGNELRKRCVLVVSRLHRLKGIFELVEAWGILRPVDWRLVIVGPDDGFESLLRNDIREKKLSDQVSIRGALYGDELTEAFCNADIFCLPSYGENFGMVYGEALAYGLPIICSTETSFNEASEHGFGWVISVNDLTAELVEVLSEVFSLSELEIKKIGEVGRRWVNKKYCWSVFAQKLVKRYTALIEAT